MKSKNLEDTHPLSFTCIFIFYTLFSRVGFAKGAEMFKKVASLFTKLNPELFTLEKFTGMFNSDVHSGDTIGLCDMTIENHTVQVWLNESDCRHYMINEAIKAKDEDCKLYIRDKSEKLEDILVYNHITKKGVWYMLTAKHINK